MMVELGSAPHLGPRWGEWWWGLKEEVKAEGWRARFALDVTTMSSTSANERFSLGSKFPWGALLPRPSKVSAILPLPADPKGWLTKMRFCWIWLRAVSTRSGVKRPGVVEFGGASCGTGERIERGGEEIGSGREGVRQWP